MGTASITGLVNAREVPVAPKGENGLAPAHFIAIYGKYAVYMWLRLAA
jgi:hypothetical protein